MSAHSRSLHRHRVPANKTPCSWTLPKLCEAADHLPSTVKVLVFPLMDSVALSLTPALTALIRVPVICFNPYAAGSIQIQDSAKKSSGGTAKVD